MEILGDFFEEFWRILEILGGFLEIFGDSWRFFEEFWRILEIFGGFFWRFLEIF